MSETTRAGRSTTRSVAHLLLAGLTATAVWSTAVTVPAYAAAPAAAAAAADPESPVPAGTYLASTPQKDAAAAAAGFIPDATTLALNDQAFVLALWRQSKADSYVKSEALRVWADPAETAAYDFITAGIFVAAHHDALDEIAAADAKVARLAVMTKVGIDPANAAWADLDDLNFIIKVYDWAEDGSFLWEAAGTAIAGTDTARTAFLTDGAGKAHDKDVARKIEIATEAEAARLRAEALVAAKKSLLQLLGLPWTQELIELPNRQYTLHIKDNAKGTEVKLAAQTAINADDDDLAQALHDFIFNGGRDANTRDEAAAAARELAGYKTQVTAIRDKARLDGWLPNLTAAANQALATGTAVALQTFLLKDQDPARAKDQKSWATVALAGNRIGVLHTNGTVFVKEGGLSASWTTQRTAVKQVVLAGDRVGVLTTDGTAWVRDGSLTTSTWVKVYSNVKQLALAGDRVGVLTTAGAALVKEGGLSASWSNQHAGVQQIALTTTRIGVLTTGGIAYVKEGGLHTDWVNERTGVTQLALSGNRIGVLGTDGTAFVKEGGLSAQWVNQHPGVKHLALAGDRIGVLTTGGLAKVKDGGLSASWSNQQSNVVKLALDGNRIGILVGDGTAYVKDGATSAPWVNELHLGSLS